MNVRPGVMNCIKVINESGTASFDNPPLVQTGTGGVFCSALSLPGAIIPQFMRTDPQ